MRKERTVQWTKWMLLAILLGMVLPAPALAQTGSGRQAGQISALVPIDTVVRQRKPLEATKGMLLNWGDVVKTERGGRVRVRLDDGSILNVGSQSQLIIEQHDAQTQRTALQLSYGRMRASVVRIANPDAGGFEVRTQAAVAGVVGTDLFTDNFQIGTTVIALGGGLVKVDSPNPQFTGLTTVLNPGEAVTLIADQRPGPKRLATTDELNNAFQETSVDEVVQLSTRMTTPGRTFQAQIAGKALTSATGVTFERQGISAQISGPLTATQIPVSITVAADVPLGTYPFTVQRPEGPLVGVLIVTTEANIRNAAAQAGGAIKPPAAQTLSVIRGAKFELDASATETPTGTTIVAFLWTIQDTRFSSNTPKFTVNTSLLPPKDYVIQLAVVNDRGQSATQRFNLTVQAGVQPVEMIRDLATGYESLQPNQFLKNFDDEKFRNYSGFASQIEDSFRSQLETARVFQRPVNCTITEEQDQAICQADFEIQFTKKDQPTEFLDQNGNPFPPGVPAPPNSSPGKRLLTGGERTTIRFERADKGWKIVDYAAAVSCPGGSQVSGVNVGSCILAIGSFSTPSFQITNVILSGGATLPVGGTLTGTFDVSPLGGFNGAITFSGAGTLGNSSVNVTFSPNPANSLGTVSFTVTAPATGPNVPTPFILTITGSDPTGAIVQNTSIALNYQGAPPFTLSQFSSPSGPLTLLANSSVVIGITAALGVSGFATPVTLTFGPLPAGVTVSPTTATINPGSTQFFTFSFVPAGNAFANFGVANVTVTGTAAGVPVQTSTILLNLSSSTSLPFSLFSSPSSNTVTLTSSSKVTTFLNVFVSTASGFTQPINMSLSTPPPGITITPSTFVFTPGVSGSNVFYTVTVDPALATPGSYPILFSGVSSGVSATTTYTLNVRGAFSLSATPQNTSSTPMILPPDGVTANNVTVTVTSINSFAGSVTVFFSNPFGSAVSVTPGTSQTISVPAGGSATATFTLVAALGAANTGTSSAFISASSPSGSATNSISGPFMTIGPAGFNLSPTSTSTTADINGTFSPTVSTFVQPLGAFGASVDFTVVSSSVPAGMSVSPTTQTIAVNSSARFTITAASPLTVGNYSITVDATSAGQPSKTFTINVRARGSLSLNVTQSPGGGVPGSSTSPLVLAPGAPAALTFNVAVGASNGFAGSSRVQVFGVPSGVTASFASSGTTVATVIAPGSDVLTLTNTTAAPISLIQLTVQASDPFNAFTNINPTASIFVTTGAIALNVVTSPTGGVPGTFSSPLILNPGAQLTFSVSVGGINGFSGSSQVQVSGMPSGVTAAFSSSGSSSTFIFAPGSDTLTLSASPTAPPLPITQLTVLARSFPSFSSSASASIFISSPSTFVLGCAQFVGGPALPCNSTNFVDLNINQSGSTSSILLQIDSFGGYSGTVNAVPRSLPAGVTMSPNPVTLTPGTPVTVTFSAATPAVAGAFSFILDGSDVAFPTLTSSTTVAGQLNGSIKLVVTPANSPTNPVIVLPGTSQVFTVDISGQNGFSGTSVVNFSPLSSPTGVTFSPTGTLTVSVPPTGSVTLTFTVTAAASAPLSTVQTIDFDAGINVSNAFTYFVPNETFVQGSYNIGPAGVGSYLMSTTPPSSLGSPLFLDPNGTAQVAIDVAIIPQFGFVGTVTISVGALPTGVSVAPTSSSLVVTSSSPVSFTFKFTATTAQGTAPITVAFSAAANISTPSGTFPVNNATSSFLLVNPAPFGLTQTGGTSTAPLSLEQGIPPGQSFQVAVTGSGSATISFANVPAGVTISPPTVNVTAGSAASFNILASASTSIGSYTISILGTAGVQTLTLSLFVNVSAPTSGIFLTTTPPTSSAAPVILQPDHTLVTFIDVNVNAKGTFAGVVNLTLTGVPTGVAATLVPATADLSTTPVQTVQFQFVTTTGLVPFAPTTINVNGASGSLTASVPIFIALQITSAIQAPGGSVSSLPQITQVAPATAFPGSHARVLLSGASLSGVSSVMSSSPLVTAQIEPGATDTQLYLDIFVRPNADAGVYSLMLATPRGVVPVRFNIVGREIDTADARDKALPGRGQIRGGRGAAAMRGGLRDSDDSSSRSVISTVEPAVLSPGQVVEGRLLGENLAGVRAVSARGLGVSVEVLEAQPDLVRVRFVVAASAAAGTRMLTVNAGGQILNAAMQIEAARVPVPARAAIAGVAAENRTAGAQPDAANADSSGDGAPPVAPDLLVRASDISMSPANPRPGDMVSFRMTLSNRSAQKAENVDVEFTLSGTNVRTRESFNFDANAVQTFHVEWQAAGSGRFEPRVVIDPDRRLNLANRANTVAALPAFALVSASGGAPAAGMPVDRQRGQLSLAASGCQGFRFGSGTEAACSSGADIEVRVAPQGGALRIEADGVRNLGSMPLEMVGQVPSGAMSAGETVQTGSVYLVQTRRGNFLVRVMDVRGMSAVRATPQAALNRPRVADLERNAPAATPSITLALEWRMANQQ